METYHKIQTLYKRNPDTKYKTVLEDHYAKPEFDFLQDNMWEFTEKVDGMNMRVILQEDKIRIAGKTDNAAIPGPLGEFMYTTFTEEKMLDMFPQNFAGICLYGEGYGGKIQKGGKYRQDQSFVLFDVKIGDFWLHREDIEKVAKELNIDVVPVVGYGTLDDMTTIVRDGMTSQWGSFEAEGLIAKPTVEMFNRFGERIITKLKTRDFR